MSSPATVSAIDIFGDLASSSQPGPSSSSDTKKSKRQSPSSPQSDQTFTSASASASTISASDAELQKSTHADAQTPHKKRRTDSPRIGDAPRGMEPPVDVSRVPGNNRGEKHAPSGSDQLRAANDNLSNKILLTDTTKPLEERYSSIEENADGSWGKHGENTDRAVSAMAAQMKEKDVVIAQLAKDSELSVKFNEMMYAGVSSLLADINTNSHASAAFRKRRNEEIAIFYGDLAPMRAQIKELQEALHDTLLMANELHERHVAGQVPLAVPTHLQQHGGGSSFDVKDFVATGDADIKKKPSASRKKVDAASK
jgi:hypothetical protein